MIGRVLLGLQVLIMGLVPREYFLLFPELPPLSHIPAWSIMHGREVAKLIPDSAHVHIVAIERRSVRYDVFLLTRMR